MRRLLAIVIACAVVNASAGALALAASQSDRDAKQAEKEAKTLAEVKAKIHRAGVGERARVTVRMKDGTKRKGYVSEQREREFVLRERKTGAPSIIAYEEVSKVEGGYGRSALSNALIATGVGLGGALLVWGLLIGTSDD